MEQMELPQTMSCLFQFSDQQLMEALVLQSLLAGFCEELPCVNFEPCPQASFKEWTKAKVRKTGGKDT